MNMHPPVSVVGKKKKVAFVDRKRDGDTINHHERWSNRSAAETTCRISWGRQTDSAPRKTNLTAKG